ncbi:MAG: DUF6644 family protein [Alphaproteobacteria bacterium]
MRDLIVWLNETAWSVYLRESFIVWPVLEATHVLTIMLFVGTIIMVDLRLLGLAYTRVPVSEMTDRILPWTIAGFIVMVVTGLVLFYAKPLVYYHNIFFRVKLLVLIAALANIWVFHRRVQKDRAVWDGGGRLPVTARLSAAVSLSAWIAIVVAGRMIAYDWYECRKLDPASLLATLQDCPAPIVTAADTP